MAKPISDVERLILANQYEILAELNDGDEELKRTAEYFREGYKWLYDTVLDGLSPNMSDDDANFVIDVLNVYRVLDSSYDQLSDKAGLTQADIAFRGFDGNNEPELMGFVAALRGSGRFTESAQAPLNSHAQMTAYYVRLLERYEEMGKPSLMTAEQIRELLS